MPRRDLELINNRSICDSQEIYANPNITALAEGRAVGDTVCPLLGPCADGEFELRGTRCAACFGHIMAKAILEGGTY